MVDIAADLVDIAANLLSMIYPRPIFPNNCVNHFMLYAIQFSQMRHLYKEMMANIITDFKNISTHYSPLLWFFSSADCLTLCVVLSRQIIHEA